MTRAARVVPDVASFSVDGGFWYSLPPHLEPDISVGSIVRVPLSGRRVRGWVVEIGESESSRLKDIAAVSGSSPVFHQRLLQSLIWAARHYVAPVSVLLSRATPPNLPRKHTPPRSVDLRGPGSEHPIGQLAMRSADGARSPITSYVGPWLGSPWIEPLGTVLAAGRSVLVVAASRAEVDVVGVEAKRLWGELAVTIAGEDAAADTAGWEAAQVAPRLVIGTPKTATWQINRLALVVVLEESRRAMKDRQTPTLHVRDVVATRARVEGFNLGFLGPTPGVELLASGAEMVKVGNRAWGLVEVVDRSEENLGDGYLSPRVVAGLKATIERGERCFVFTHRRVGAAATRCASCRSLRTCSSCGRRLGRVAECPSCSTPAGPCATCGATEFEELGTIPERLLSEVERKVGRDVAAVAPAAAPIVIGTERDLAGLERVALAVAADLDGMLVGAGYRTEEEALRQLARVASKVKAARGTRLMLQTTRPDSSLIAAMRRGDPMPYLEQVLVGRAREGFPPSSSMLAIELRGTVPDDTAKQIEELGDDHITLGPMAVDGGQRWLLTGQLDRVRDRLRPQVGKWRDLGVVVRIDADPIDV